MCSLLDGSDPFSGQFEWVQITGRCEQIARAETMIVQLLTAHHAGAAARVQEHRINGRSISYSVAEESVNEDVATNIYI